MYFACKFFIIVLMLEFGLSFFPFFLFLPLFLVPLVFSFFIFSLSFAAPPIEIFPGGSGLSPSKEVNKGEKISCCTALIRRDLLHNAYGYETNADLSPGFEDSSESLRRTRFHEWKPLHSWHAPNPSGTHLFG